MEYTEVGAWVAETREAARRERLSDNWNPQEYDAPESTPGTAESWRDEVWNSFSLFTL